MTLESQLDMETMHSESNSETIANFGRECATINDHCQSTEEEDLCQKRTVIFSHVVHCTKVILET